MSGAILLPLDVRILIWKFLGSRPYYNKYTGKIHRRIINIAKRYATLNMHCYEFTNVFVIKIHNMLSLSRHHKTCNMMCFEESYTNNKIISYNLYKNNTKQISKEYFTINNTKLTQSWRKRIWKFIKGMALC